MRRIRGYLASLGAGDEPPTVVETLDAEAKRIRDILTPVVRQGHVPQAASQDSHEVKKFVAGPREFQDEAERDVLAAEADSV